ncbi:MAG: hypothetical protein WC453_01815 [Patescibacteria group bacterium]
MKNIIPKDTRYIPLTQQNSCCVPTSLSMVMYRQGLPLLPQELLGYHLGLILDKKHKDLFWNARTGKRPATGFGTQMHRKEFSINAVFKKLKIPLRAAAYPINSFKNKSALISFIGHEIKTDQDLVVLLASDILNNTKKHNGHACVIDRIYTSRNIIRLVDPAATQAKWREISLDKFIKAVKSHPTGQGRILALAKVDERKINHYH